MIPSLIIKWLKCPKIYTPCQSSKTFNVLVFTIIWSQFVPYNRINTTTSFGTIGVDCLPLMFPKEIIFALIDLLKYRTVQDITSDVDSQALYRHGGILFHHLPLPSSQKVKTFISLMKKNKNRIVNLHVAIELGCLPREVQS